MENATLGDRLRELREGRGYSQAGFEEVSGVHRNTVNGIETGKQKARPSTVRKLAEALGVDVEDLTGIPKGEGALFSDVPPRGSVERRTDSLMAPVDLIEGAEEWFRSEMAEGAGLEAVGRMAWLHKLFVDHTVERYGLHRGSVGLPPEEARALDRLATALDDLRSVVDDGYRQAIRNLSDQQAEVRLLGAARRNMHRTDEGGTAEAESRSA